jgi:short-subunit dehydrogenase
MAWTCCACRRVLEQARRIDVPVNNAGAGLLGAKTLVTRFGRASKRKLFGINIDVTTAQPSPHRSPIEK